MSQEEDWQSVQTIVAPRDPAADVGFLTMESEEWVPMSGSNTICVTTALLENGIVDMQEPTTFDSRDPYPDGFRVSDSWHNIKPHGLLEVIQDAQDFCG